MFCLFNVDPARRNSDKLRFTGQSHFRMPLDGESFLFGTRVFRYSTYNFCKDLTFIAWIVVWALLNDACDSLHVVPAHKFVL